jgi:hypothetical protein
MEVLFLSVLSRTFIDYLSNKNWSLIMHPIKHFLTITYHKFLVMQGCFGVGLYKQGLLHDLSKYSFSEFMVGAKYYQGDQSPNNMERRDRGYSSAWLHHKGRNKHHYEYWVDYSTKAVRGEVVPVEMPVKYVVEMMMDRIAASKVYNGKKYQDSFPLEAGRETIHVRTGRFSSGIGELYPGRWRSINSIRRVRTWGRKLRALARCWRKREV